MSLSCPCPVVLVTFFAAGFPAVLLEVLFLAAAVAACKVWVASRPHGTSAAGDIAIFSHAQIDYVVIVSRAISILLSFFFCFFFGVAQAFKRRFCSGICYFLVFLLPILLRFGGSNMLQRGDYAREICYFVAVHASPFLLKPACIIYHY